MSLHLWRGERELGEIQARSPLAGPQLTGVLLPAEGCPPLEGLWQVRHTWPDGETTVFHSPLEPEVVGERAGRPGTSAAGPAALEPLTAEEARGVPVARQLSVRDEAGHPLRATQILLREIRVDMAGHDPEVAALPPGALRHGSIWSLMVSLTR